MQKYCILADKNDFFGHFEIFLLILQNVSFCHFLNQNAEN